jgi:hypothetical protein
MINKSHTEREPLTWLKGVDTKLPGNPKVRLKVPRTSFFLKKKTFLIRNIPRQQDASVFSFQQTITNLASGDVLLTGLWCSAVSPTIENCSLVIYLATTVKGFCP